MAKKISFTAWVLLTKYSVCETIRTIVDWDFTPPIIESAGGLCRYLVGKRADEDAFKFISDVWRLYEAEAEKSYTISIEDASNLIAANFEICGIVSGNSSQELYDAMYTRVNAGVT